MIWLKLQSLLPGQLGVSKTGMVPSLSFFFFLLDVNILIL